jgi:hypothetical protein
MTLPAPLDLRLTDRTYLERGEPVVVLIRWVTMPPAAAGVIWFRPPRRNAPRNVLIERVGGMLVVRPFRGLRKRPDNWSEAVAGPVRLAG